MPHQHESKCAFCVGCTTLCETSFNDYYHRCECCNRIIHDNNINWRGDYPYASTTAILTAAMKAVKFSGVCEEVPINDGNIIRIDSDGKLSVSTFEAQVQHFDWRYLYHLYGYDFEDKDEDYTNDLLMICGCYGVAREDVELLLEFGYSCDEIEEMLFEPELL